MCWLVEGFARSRIFRVIKNLLLIERVQNFYSYRKMSASQRLKSADIKIVQPLNKLRSATSGFFHTHFLLEHEPDVVFVLKPPFFDSRVVIH